MPQEDSGAETVKIKELHPTFGAEVLGVDFSKPIVDIVDDTINQIRSAMAKYGVCVFRNTGLDDKGHIDFASRFGDLDSKVITPHLLSDRPDRVPYDQLWDVGNLDDDGNLQALDSERAQINKGNTLFHVDSSFKPRRAGYSMLLAHELPPRGTGGNTEFADSRTAFDELPPALKERLIEKDYVAAHSVWQSRRLAAPEAFADAEPLDFYMGRHRLVQRHEASGRMNLYIAAHVHHVEGLPADESEKLVAQLLAHVTQPKYVLSVEWQNVGDLVIWDNTCVLHRGVPMGEAEGKYRRDMRRATLHDGSASAWGLNERTDVR